MSRNALLNFLQSASNEAAGAVSVPVDLLGMGLRGLGVPVPRNALLSSEWMRQNGLLGEVKPGASQVAGATFRFPAFLGVCPFVTSFRRACRPSLGWRAKGPSRRRQCARAGLARSA